MLEKVLSYARKSPFENLKNGQKLQIMLQNARYFFRVFAV